LLIWYLRIRLVKIWLMICDNIHNKFVNLIKTKNYPMDNFSYIPLWNSSIQESKLDIWKLHLLLWLVYLWNLLQIKFKVWTYIQILPYFEKLVSSLNTRDNYHWIFRVEQWMNLTKPLKINIEPTKLWKNWVCYRL